MEIIKENKENKEKEQKENSALVVEDNTIYEIDLECYQKMYGKLVK